MRTQTHKILYTHNMFIENLLMIDTCIQAFILMDIAYRYLKGQITKLADNWMYEKLLTTTWYIV